MKNARLEQLEAELDHLEQEYEEVDRKISVLRAYRITIVNRMGEIEEIIKELKGPHGAILILLLTTLV